MIKVLIADDIPLLRDGLKAALSYSKEIEVVGCAGDGREAFTLCGSLSPDVVLMDMRMADFDGAYGTKLIKQNYPDIKVLVLTTFDDDETVKRAVASGADGYILKEMETEKIINSIKTVSGGMNVFARGVFPSVKGSTAQASPLAESLTQRERDIIALIAEGCDNKEISAKLYLAEGTVRNNISRMLEKLGLKDRTQLAVFALKNNIC